MNSAPTNFNNSVKGDKQSSNIDPINLIEF